jgi:hypothetical protein
MPCRVGSYAVLRLHIAHAYTSRKLLAVPRNTSLRLGRSAIDSAMIILVFS